jgi:hypothetical protein
MSTAGIHAAPSALLLWYPCPDRHPGHLPSRGTVSCPGPGFSGGALIVITVTLFSPAFGQATDPTTRKNAVKVNAIHFLGTVFTVQ